ncbi:MAG: SpoIIE family protein phosphatase [Akkermansiaceae bacterium]
MEETPQDRLELALQASNEGVWDWYVNQEEIYYSPRVLTFLGYTEDAAPNIFCDPAAYLHEDDMAEFSRAFDGALEDNGHDVLATDTRYRHPDGSWHWLRIRGVVVRGDDAVAIRMVGSIIDISKRKNAEKALEEERHRLKELIENIPVNVYYKDKDSKFILANSSTAEKLGAGNVENLIGKCDHDFFDTHHADIARNNELEIMQTRRPQINATQRETWDDKDDTWAETSKLPWLDIKGKLIGTFGITSDITDLVRTQQMLGRTADELQARNTAIEEELQLAREIQQAMLPQSLDGLQLRSDMREVTFGCRYLPASEMAGDFFEIIPISQHSIGIFICDVMGHGVRASLVVSMLRGLMEKERESASNPEWFLYGINEGLVSILERANVTLFASALYCVVNLKAGTLEYTCAGHPAPVVLRLGKSRILEPEKTKPNPALGLIQKAEYEAHTLPLDDIDRLLLFTDGLYEAENETDAELGMESVLKCMEDNANTEIDDTLDAILTLAQEHAGSKGLADDLCLLALEVGSGL